MKYLVPLSAAVLVLAACSESTAPTASADLNPSYAKPAPPPAPAPTFSFIITDDFYNFTGSDITGSSGSTFATGPDDGIGTASPPVVQTAPFGERFLGRHENINTVTLLVVANGGDDYYLKFDLYAIGSLDGKGKQAQRGTFLANFFQVTALCEGSIPDQLLFSSSFSNQLTVQQDYPANIALGESGGNKAGTGSFAQDSLGYRTTPLISHTPQFRSFGDVSYHIPALTGVNPCGAGEPVTFEFSNTNPDRQSNYDESFGVDNVTITTGTISN